jgi:hypothetical protein
MILDLKAEGPCDGALAAALSATDSEPPVRLRLVICQSPRTRS